MSEGSSEITEVTPKKTTSKIKHVGRAGHLVHRPKTFGDTLEGKAIKGVGKVSLVGAKLGGKGMVELGKGGFALGRDAKKLTETTLRAVWRNKRDLSILGAGAVVGAALANPDGARDVSAKAYDEAVKQVGNIRDIGGKMPSETAYDDLVKKEVPDNIIEKVVDVHYPGTASEDRDKLKYEVELMSIYMAERITAEGYENIAQHMPILEEECAKTGVNPGVIVGMLGAETGGGVLGKLEHKTDAGALGPLGITDGYAVENGVVITNDENDPRLDWRVSVALACRGISENTRDLGNVSLAVAAWHRGSGAVREDVAFWANANGLTIDGTIAEFVQAHSVTDWQLRQNKELRESWETEGADHTNIYTLRVAGSNAAVENTKAFAKQISDDIPSQGE